MLQNTTLYCRRRDRGYCTDPSRHRISNSSALEGLIELFALQSTFSSFNNFCGSYCAFYYLQQQKKQQQQRKTSAVFSATLFTFC